MNHKRFFALTLLAAASLSAQAAAINLDADNLSYQQNFDSLAASGTTGTALPAGWSFLETGNSANTSYGVSDGSSNTGNTYSFGKTGSSDRALGGLLSSNLVPVFGVSFVNQAGRAIESLSISYVGEQWRLGANNRNDRLNFQYSTDATALNNGSWKSLGALDFIAPVSTGGARALDGNANSRSLSGSIAGLNLAQGGSLWLRWSDVDASGADDGLAIDNFSLNATLAPVPEPSSYALLLAGLGAVGLMSRRRLGR